MSNATSTKFDVPLSDAAKELSLSWFIAWRLLLSGQLAGEKRGNRWYTSRESIDALRESLNNTTPAK